ncbi:phage tail tape measure protein [Metabacillus dongyingensis]|uniref:phage tail tape measure protein n=1 Tax=Metabacillus dongyingensis TaxID=2874282 RepID=UPI003B8ACA78
MEIFKLFGSIFVDNDKANDAIDETDQKGEALGGRLSALGGLATTLGGIMGGALVAGLGAAVTGVGALVYLSDDLQKSLNTLQAQTGASGKEMQGMESSLMNIYKNNYGESFEDIATSMALVKQNTGASGEELEKMTTRALMMRDTFGFEVNESIRTVDKMMKNFGITSEEAFTLLAQGQQKGLNASDDMFDTFSEYAPVFKQLGFDAEAMFNILADGAANGVFNTDFLADAIKEFGIRVKDGSETTKTAFQGIGLDAIAMSKEFAKGGDSAQSAFEKTMAGLAKIEDPIKRNEIGVSLFGTKFEDLEHKAILSLGNVEKVADKSADTLDKIDKVKYNSVGEAIKGLGRIVIADLLVPIQEKVMPGINNFVNDVKSLFSGLSALAKGDSMGFIEIITKNFSKDKQMPIINFFLGIRDEFNRINDAVTPFKSAIEGVFNLFKGDSSEGINLLAKIGLNYEQIILINNAVGIIKSAFAGLVTGAMVHFSNIKTAITGVFSFLAPYIMPLLESIVSFIGQKIQMISQFWSENGTQIMTAVQNAFNMILSIIQFVMPAVLFIINMIWQNIQGVINGGLNVIMGAIKIFTGLFTGDFSAMWEGIKQLFSGAIEFVWNLMSLLFIGRILGGIKAFVSQGISAVSGLWTKVIEIFKNMDNQVGSVVANMVSKVINFFKGLYNNAKSIFESARAYGVGRFTAMRDAISNTVRSLVDNVLGKFSSIRDGIASRLSDVLSKAKYIFGQVKSALTGPVESAKEGIRRAIDTIKSFFNSMKLTLPKIKLPHFKLKNWSANPLNWVKAMPTIGIDWYAKGTNYARGGWAMVGENGPELMSVEKGAKVKTAAETRSILNTPSNDSLPGNLTVVFEMDGYQMGKLITPNVSMNQGQEVRLKSFLKGG